MTAPITGRAVATGLPADTTTRRTALAALAGLGAAMALPKAVQATPAGDPEVAELTRLYDAARRRDAISLAACEAADESGDRAAIDAARDEYATAWREQEAPVRLRIIDLQSTDPAALRLKARVYLDSLPYNDKRFGLDDCITAAISEQGGPWEDAVAASIVRDVVLATIGGAA